MTLITKTLATENLDDLTEDQMSALAHQMNAIEPGGSHNGYMEVFTASFEPVIDVLAYISIFAVLASLAILSVPLIRHLNKKFTLTRF